MFTPCTRIIDPIVPPFRGPADRMIRGIAEKKKHSPDDKTRPKPIPGWPVEPEIFTAPRGDIQGTRSSDYLCDHRDQLTFDPIPDEHSNCLLVEAMFRLEDEVPA